MHKAFNLIHRPARVDWIILKLPSGFDNYEFEVEDAVDEFDNKKNKRILGHILQEIFHVDGSSIRDGRGDCRASWAVCCEYNKTLELSGQVIQNPSNQAGEITAAIKPCECAHEKGFEEITIVTDSSYVHNAATKDIDKWKNNGWLDHKKKLVKNIELLLILQE